MSTFDDAMSATTSSSEKQKTQKRTGFSTETSRASGGVSKKTKVGRKKVSAMEKVQFLASKATFIENIRKSNTLRNERSITKHDFQKLLIQFGCKEQSCRPGMVSSVFKQQSNPRLPSREIVEAMKRANSAFCKEPKSLLVRDVMLKQNLQKPPAAVGAKQMKLNLLIAQKRKRQNFSYELISYLTIKCEKEYAAKRTRYEATIENEMRNLLEFQISRVVYKLDLDEDYVASELATAVEKRVEEYTSRGLLPVPEVDDETVVNDETVVDVPSKPIDDTSVNETDSSGPYESIDRSEGESSDDFSNPRDHI